jgi:ABC-type nitrate/sulfonate/bicarbonate transport system permease component
VVERRAGVRQRVLALSLELAVPAALVAGWWLWTTTHDSFFFPALPDILRSFADTWIFERVGSDVGPSLKRLSIGFCAAAVVAVTVGVLLGQSSFARRAASPIIEFLRAIPPVALLPFGILVIGIGDTMKIAIIATVCLWPILLNTVDAVASLDPTLEATTRVYGVKGFERLRHVVLPAAAPQIAAGLRTSLSLSLIMMVVSEMVASTNGIGYFILQSQRTFAIPEMWSGILLLGFLGYVLNLIFVLLEQRVLRWHRGARATSRAA